MHSLELSDYADYCMLEETKPILSDDKQYVTYGLYPQDAVLEDELTQLLEEHATKLENGWYLYEGKYYAKAERMWFYCQPIVWKVIKITGDTALVMSKELLDNCIFNDNYEGKVNGHYSCDYISSKIRKWLNEDFYKSAFMLNDEYVLTTEIDNFLKDHDNPNKDWKTEKTNDKVFLLSEDEYYKYYNDNRKEGTADVTRWAVFHDVYEEYYDDEHGEYWLRTSSHFNNVSQVFYISSGGNISYCYPDCDSHGVRPVINIKLY